MRLFVYFDSVRDTQSFFFFVYDEKIGQAKRQTDPNSVHFCMTLTVMACTVLCIQQDSVNERKKKKSTRRKYSSCFTRFSPFGSSCISPSSYRLVVRFSAFFPRRSVV